MDQKILDKIKSRGFWRINFRPVGYSQQLSLAECEEIIKKNSIQLRGWDYPHVPQRSGDDTDILRHTDYVEGWVDWSYFKEFWRMYKSSQFLHYLGFRIDWLDEETSIFTKREKIPAPKSEFGVVEATYQLTEIFEFLSRLIQSGLYTDGVEVIISLHNLSKRKLTVDNTRRVPFMFERLTGAQEYKYSNNFSKDDILTDPKEPARTILLEIFELFGWDDPPIDTLKKDQEDLLLRRF